MLESYRNRMAAMGGYEGEARRRNAQNIMDASWMRDPATKPVYVKWCDAGTPVVDDDDEVLYAKYNVKSYHNITGDEVNYLLQFRLEDLKNRPDIKVGSYVQIRNEMDEFEWWLIVHEDDRTQFHQFSILKCLHVYKWISRRDGKRVIHQCLGVPRSQSSYNSGVWLDYTFQTTENQQIVFMPTNEDSKCLNYDDKFLISESGRYPPLAWKVTKVQPSFNGDITRFTLAQEMFDPVRDSAELLIANYFDSAVQSETPELEEIPTVSDLEITYSGSPAVKAGGGFKKFTLKSRIDGKLVDCADEVEWSIDFPDGDSEKLETSIAGNVIRIKCKNDYYLIGKTFTITATTKYSSKTLVAEVASL